MRRGRSRGWPGRRGRWPAGSPSRAAATRSGACVRLYRCANMAGSEKGWQGGASDVLQLTDVGDVLRRPLQARLFLVGRRALSLHDLQAQHSEAEEDCSGEPGTERERVLDVEPQ